MSLNEVGAVLLTILPAQLLRPQLNQGGTFLYTFRPTKKGKRGRPTTVEGSFKQSLLKPTGWNRRADYRRSQLHYYQILSKSIGSNTKGTRWEVSSGEPNVTSEVEGFSTTMSDKRNTDLII
jgi:hypothetical protein